MMLRTMVTRVRVVMALAVASCVSGGALANASDTDREPLANVIRWATASEVRNFGYDVYRGESEQGPFERVTDLPISGHGTTDVPNHYAFRDETIAPNTVYFYYVESISMDGERERFTPIFESKPKSPQ